MMNKKKATSKTHDLPFIFFLFYIPQKNITINCATNILKNMLSG